MSRFAIEGLNERGQWRALGAKDPSHYVDFLAPAAAGDNPNSFATRESAEAELPRLAEIFGCDVSELRVVEA